MEGEKRPGSEDLVERLASWIPPEDRLVAVKRDISYRDFTGAGDSCYIFDPEDEIDGLYFN